MGGWPVRRALGVAGRRRRHLPRGGLNSSTALHAATLHAALLRTIGSRFVSWCLGRALARGVKCVQILDSDLCVSDLLAPGRPLFFYFFCIALIFYKIVTKDQNFNLHRASDPVTVKRIAYRTVHRACTPARVGGLDGPFIALPEETSKRRVGATSYFRLARASRRRQI